MHFSVPVTWSWNFLAIYEHDCADNTRYTDYAFGCNGVSPINPGEYDA